MRYIAKSGGELNNNTINRHFRSGRKQESEELNRIYNRNKAELVAIYGRRRVGKKYLVDETFEGVIIKVRER